jgi:hypothetical protein
MYGISHSLYLTILSCGSTTNQEMLQRPEFHCVQSQFYFSSRLHLRRFPLISEEPDYYSLTVIGTLRVSRIKRPELSRGTALQTFFAIIVNTLH